MRRLTQEDLDTLRRQLDRDNDVYGAPAQHLRQHLIHLSGEALRKAGPLPEDGTYTDAESGVTACIGEKGWGPVIAALRETTGPDRFADYMRDTLRHYFISVGRRQKRPRLWQRTADLLAKNEGRRYTCLERNRNKRLRWWGRDGWPPETPRHKPETDELRKAGEQALAPLPRVRDRRDKKYAPKILSKESLNDLVAGTMDGVSEALTLDHYGWLFPLLFPAEYARIDAESYDERVEVMGNAGEIGVEDLSAFVDARVDIDILDWIPSLDVARRLLSLHRHGGDANAASDELGVPPEEILGDREMVERFLRHRGFSAYDLDRVMDRVNRAAPC